MYTEWNNLKCYLGKPSLFFTILIALFFSFYSTFSLGSTVPKTGQTTSYLQGDDGSLNIGVAWPSPRFKDNGDGTVSDELTGLLWLKNGICTVQRNWLDALTNGATLSNGVCGLTDGSKAGDWRLPNIKELASLLSLGVVNPAVPDTQGTNEATQDNPFTNLQNEEYWSSTSNVQDPNFSFTVNFKYGHITRKIKTTGKFSIYVRSGNVQNAPAQTNTTGQTSCYNSAGTQIDCAETGQDGDTQTGREWPSPRFTDLGDGSVLDNLTQLIWLKNANCFNLTGWTSAVNMANGLANGSCGLSDESLPGDWRMPNRNELASLLDYGNFSPALPNTTGNGQWSQGDPFTNVEPSGYWTSTTYEAFNNNAWYVNFFRGIIGSEGKQGTAYLWPVRSAESNTLEVTIAGSGKGSVTSSPSGISCPGDCKANFTADSDVILTANPQDGNRFKEWSEKSCGQNLTCTVTMSQSVSVTATFSGENVSVSNWLLLLLD